MERIKNNIDVLELFENKDIVKVCAPMVRYSKLPFRNLVTKYGCDLTFTPMILADSFCKSEKARDNEFTTNLLDTPVVTQFAANTVHDFVGAAYLASPFCNGVDLNCGCPQRWARQMNVGCVLLEKPEIIFDVVRQCRNQISKPFTVSVKLRISKNISDTLNICKQLEMAGVSFITVHARTSTQLTGDINVEALHLLSSSTRVPIVANGGIKSLEDCHELQKKTKCKGVMVANGLLNNPTLFTGSNKTSMDCIQTWLDLCYNSAITPERYEKLHTETILLTPTISERPFNLMFQCFHHHLVFMLDKILTRKQKRVFNNMTTFKQVLEFIETNFNMVPRLFNEEEYRLHKNINTDYLDRDNVYKQLKPNDIIESDADFLFDYEKTGKFFKSIVNESEKDFNNEFNNLFMEND